MIDDEVPADWQALETRVSQTLAECGFDVHVHEEVELARGDAIVDVYAVEHTSPPNVVVVECKHWATAVTKSVVHAFRSVVVDSGANTGLIVSSGGFQEGALEAARYTNIRLVTWGEFQEIYEERWFREHMAPRLKHEGEALAEYTEPINSRVFRKADKLSTERLAEFKRLREKHLPLALVDIAFMPAVLGLPRLGEPILPKLPLRASVGSRDEQLALLPPDVLEATALRPLMTTLIEHYRDAIAEFDAVFGERA